MCPVGSHVWGGGIGSPQETSSRSGRLLQPDHLQPQPPPQQGRKPCLGCTYLNKRSGAPFCEGRSRTPGPQRGRLLDLATQPRAASGRGRGTSVHGPAPQTPQCPPTLLVLILQDVPSVPSTATCLGATVGSPCLPARVQLELRGLCSRRPAQGVGGSPAVTDCADRCSPDRSAQEPVNKGR